MDIKRNLTVYYTIARKEISRLFRIWTQTLFPPVITQSLYFLIFGKFIGSQVRDINGVSYIAFIVPGLVMMSVITNSFINVAGSFFSSKFQRSIEELLVAPVPDVVMIAGYVTGGVFRGLLVGTLVFIVSIAFTSPVIHSMAMVFLFITLTSIVFALSGLLSGIFASTFDDVSIFPAFVLTPLIYLGGVFYSINSLPPFWQMLLKFNPVLYMVNGLRYGFYGFADVNVIISLLLLVLFAVLLFALNVYLLRKGMGMRS